MRRTLALLLLMLALSGCPGPTSDREALRAAAAAARSLRAEHPPTPQGWAEVPQGQWPLAIARLNPERVVVYRWGVDISTKSFFDGGWGYHVAEKPSDLPMLDGCYSEETPGMFWHGPC